MAEQDQNPITPEQPLRRDWVQIYLARLGLAETIETAEKPLSDD